MADIVGVRLKKAGRVYYFSPAGIELKVNDYVVVKTSRGNELGHVVIAPTQVLDSELTEPLEPVLAKATEEDVRRADELAKKEVEALVECGKLIAKLGLAMKLLAAEYSLDGTHLTFLFSAEERVDFRELLRELSGRFRVRVELRQVGPRDEAKIIGDYGRCGRPLCCATFLDEFTPVSIKMAKEQDLPLNPMKISGVCGRLLCCLTFENDQYRALKEKLPRRGTRVKTAMGPAVVIGSNPLKESVLVELESKAAVELPLSEVTVEPPPQSTPAPPPQKEAGKPEAPAGP